MNEEQLNAHRDDFERHITLRYNLTPKEVLDDREGAEYESNWIDDAWQAYQWALADVAKAAPVGDAQPVAAGDFVLVPRALLGSACSAIDKKRDSPKTLAELRRYTTGDLYAAAQPVEVQRVPLTDAQVEAALKAGHMHSTPTSRKDMRRAIEAAQGITT